MVNFQLDKTSLTFDSSQINTNIIDKPKTTNSSKASSFVEYTPEMDRQLQELKRNGVISEDFKLIKPESTGGKIDAQLARKAQAEKLMHNLQMMFQNYTRPLKTVMI